MKILYISKFDLPDYQADMIFHGLRSLFGEDCVDYNLAWYMYDDFRNYWANKVPSNGMEYGRGFTLYGRLPKLNIDRNDIEAKIRNHYFEKIVYGSITRNADFFQSVKNYYERNDIITIDGEDNQSVNIHMDQYSKYYKRELKNSINTVNSLNFCIPKENIIKEIPKKEKDYATIIPGDKSTYIYTEEKPYFEDYQKSYFGLTSKKGGWDCLRHYEILMNGCIPFFPGLEECPKQTMTRFPKKLVLDAMEKIKKGDDLSFYEEYVTLLLNHVRKNLTTEEVAKSIL